MVFKLQSLIGWHTGHDYVKEQRSQVSINLKTRLMYISDTFSSFIEHIFINIPARIRIRIALSGFNGLLDRQSARSCMIAVRWALTCHLSMALSFQWYYLVVLHLHCIQNFSKIQTFNQFSENNFYHLKAILVQLYH